MKKYHNREYLEEEDLHSLKYIDIEGDKYDLYNIYRDTGHITCQYIPDTARYGCTVIPYSRKEDSLLLKGIRIPHTEEFLLYYEFFNIRLRNLDCKLVSRKQKKGLHLLCEETKEKGKPSKEEKFKIGFGE